MKHLPKHLQPRWRYLAVGVETWPDADIDRATLQGDLWGAARSLFGDVGSARLDLTVLSAEITGGDGGFVLRTRRGAVDRARAVVASLTEVDGHDVGVRVRGVSGTVQSCEEKYMGARPKNPEQRDVVFRETDRSGWVRGSRVDLRADGSFTGATTLDLG